MDSLDKSNHAISDIEALLKLAHPEEDAKGANELKASIIRKSHEVPQLHSRIVSTPQRGMRALIDSVFGSRTVAIGCVLLAASGIFLFSGLSDFANQAPESSVIGVESVEGPAISAGLDLSVDDVPSIEALILLQDEALFAAL